MAPSTHCPRHAPRIWMASCPDCTAWHLARAIALRDHASASSAGTMPPVSLPAPRRRDGHAVPTAA
jgi:hypothetical protein